MALSIAKYKVLEPMHWKQAAKEWLPRGVMSVQPTVNMLGALGEEVRVNQHSKKQSRLITYDRDYVFHVLLDYFGKMGFLSSNGEFRTELMSEFFSELVNEAKDYSQRKREQELYNQAEKLAPTFPGVALEDIVSMLRKLEQKEKPLEVTPEVETNYDDSKDEASYSEEVYLNETFLDEADNNKSDIKELEPEVVIPVKRGRGRPKKVTA